MGGAERGAGRAVTLCRAGEHRLPVAASPSGSAPSRSRVRAAAAAGPVSAALRRALRAGHRRKWRRGAGPSGWSRPGGLNAA